MASSALEAKINKIRQQNEEIRRRYEEVEEDKKNAAKLNALVKMVPSTDWPERKEPPEFSNPPKAKLKPTKEKHEYTSQSHPIEGKKIHTFAQGEGPPPDPKYNFLADSEREEPTSDYGKEATGNRSHNRVTRGSFRKRAGGRESIQKDNKAYKGNFRDESQPGYDAWRAERNRIDEDRISRQRTAEGNWRREWDNDKMHIVDDVTKKSRPTLGDFSKKDHKDSERRSHTNNNEHTNHNRGGNHRPYRGASKNFHGNYDNRPHNTYDQHKNNSVSTKVSLSSSSEERTVIATDKSLKVTVNQGNATKGALMSVKVNSPSIAGTGRVGPRQRTRITYSHSDAETPVSEGESFYRQKSFEDKSKGNYLNSPKSPNIKRSHSQKKKDGDSKYPYNQRKDLKKEDVDTNMQEHHENEFIPQKLHYNKSPELVKGNTKAETEVSDTNSFEKDETQECLNSDTEKVENNVTVENTEMVEISTVTVSDETETNNTDKEEVNDTNETKNEIQEAIAVNEAEEASVNSASIAENSKHVVEDNTEKNILDEKGKLSEELANNSKECLQENVGESSEILVPSDVHSKQELVSKESNNVSDDVESENSSVKDVEQSPKQAREQNNNNCDNIKDEVNTQQSTEDNPTTSLEDKTNSVIENIDQLVCNNEGTQIETSETEQRKEENDTSSEKHTENAAGVNNDIVTNSDGNNEKMKEAKEEV